MHGAVAAAVAEPDIAEEEQALTVRQRRPTRHLLGLGAPRLIQRLLRRPPLAAAAVPRHPTPSPLRRRG